jgi:MFS family permease
LQREDDADFGIDDKGLHEEVVAFLFMIGFLSAGISASFTGAFADRYGRRLACLAYCVIYSISCLTLLSDRLPVLFFGRVLGGMSGTLLYSVFESWMVAEFNRLMLVEAEATLSGIFSTMTMLNSLVAIVAGVVAEGIVQRTGSAKAPFMASIICLSLAFIAILHYWGENFGGNKYQDNTSETAALLEEQKNADALPKTSAFKQVLQDARILALALTSCFFEGSLFLFIFFKFPALTLSHKVAGSTGGMY